MSDNLSGKNKILMMCNFSIKLGSFRNLFVIYSFANNTMYIYSNNFC